MEKLFYYFLQVGRGLGFSLALLFGGFCIGVILGTLVAVARHTRLRFLMERFVSVIRGTPLILQLSLTYFVIPGVFGVRPSVMTSGIIAFGINSSAYVAEILRAGIESLPKGQFEAAQTLGIPKYYAWKDIILPQVIANIFPALVNEVISLLKETSIISVIGGMDIMRRAQIVAAERFEYFTPLCVAGVCYYILVLLIESIGKKIEEKFFYAKY
ncbi:MAG: amino acid ABC transporter permease [Holosporaceae bacterium]|nr:amino acid ABC transporter permease [Holosporaceae bacterium]